jgi:hypothetical protein
MGKRFRLSRRTGPRGNQPHIGTDQPSQNKNRRMTFAAVLAIAAVGLVVVAVCSVVVYRTPAASSVDGKPNDPRSREVEELIRRYFRTWSSRDMKGYGECFLNNACIQFIDLQGRIEQHGLPSFLAYQGELLREGRYETELPESIDIRFEAELARVVVYWKLTAGPTTTHGCDHFTLMKHEGKWKVVNLVFYETRRPG